MILVRSVWSIYILVKRLMSEYHDMEAGRDIHLGPCGIVSLAIEGSRSSSIKRHKASLVS